MNDPITVMALFVLALLANILGQMIWGLLENAADDMIDKDDGPPGGISG